MVGIKGVEGGNVGMVGVKEVGVVGLEGGGVKEIGWWRPRGEDGEVKGGGAWWSRDEVVGSSGGCGRVKGWVVGGRLLGVKGWGGGCLGVVEV